MKEVCPIGRPPEKDDDKEIELKIMRARNAAANAVVRAMVKDCDYCVFKGSSSGKYERQSQ